MDNKYRIEMIDPTNERPSLVKIGMKEQLDWIKRQLEYLNFSEKFKLKYTLKKGEIYEFDWGINVNAEFSNRHYGVVLMDSDEYNPLVMVCPLKTNHHGAHPKSDIDIGCVPELNPTKSSLAVINQIRTLDKLRLFTKRAIGHLDNRNFCEEDEEDIRDAKKIVKLDNAKVDRILNAYIVMFMQDKINN